ncbi:MAG: hypothetical protein KH326_06400, partial [Ruminococcus callidus]|uniref:hypothetical protein n=1 Tax=Ruminococcus callidus TaxID=40519 RepID=UPI0023F399FB
CMSGKGFLGNMTENLQADCVQSRQAGFMQCFLYYTTWGHFFQYISTNICENIQRMPFQMKRREREMM